MGAAGPDRRQRAAEPDLPAAAPRDAQCRARGVRADARLRRPRRRRVAAGSGRTRPGGDAAPAKSPSGGCDGSPGTIRRHRCARGLPTPCRGTRLGRDAVYRMRGLSGRGPTRLGPPADLPDLWVHGVLRLLAPQARPPALRRRGPPGCPIGRAGRELALVLPRQRARLSTPTVRRRNRAAEPTGPAADSTAADAAA